MHRDMFSAGGSWGAGDREPQKGQEEEGPERQAEARAAWSVHTGRLALAWAGQGHVSLGMPNIPFEVVCLEVVSNPFPSPPASLWDSRSDH